jgi:hypothetical protein
MGAKPAELPVERRTIFELVPNLKSAMGLGLVILTRLPATADDDVACWHTDRRCQAPARISEAGRRAGVAGNGWCRRDWHMPVERMRWHNVHIREWTNIA